MLSSEAGGGKSCKSLTFKFSVKPANSEVVDTEQVLCVSPARNHMESEPGFGFREKSMKR